MKFQAVRKSSNIKTGPIPVTYSQRETCPPSCPHYLDDCYAEGFHTRMTWDKIPDRGVELAALLRFIEAMPEGQIWRHNVAGDISGEGEAVDAVELGQIVAANRGRKGFTYTHKKSADAIKWARHSTQWGFTINLSADDAGEADHLAAHGLPVVCIVPMDTPKHTTTPEGRPVPDYRFPSAWHQGTTNRPESSPSYPDSSGLTVSREALRAGFCGKLSR